MAATNSFDVEKGEISTDDLQFHDTPLTPQGSPVKSQTHTFSQFPEGAAHATESDEEGDKKELLGNEKQPPSMWTFQYYQQFFDVDTTQVFRRVTGSIIPNPKSNFLENHIRPNPDLYGPFWVCTTLVFTTAIAGNLANYIQRAGKDYQWQYDFHKVTFAAAAIFSYWWLVPTLFWALLWWRRSTAGYTFLELICIYGYSLSIYIPISVLWVVPFNWLQWLLVLLGMLLSGSVLLITLWPAVRDDDKKVAGVILALVLLLHGLLAVGFVLYFFHVPDMSSAGHQALNTTTTLHATTHVKPTHVKPTHVTGTAKPH